MTTQTLSHDATSAAPQASLSKRLGLVAYRLIERMTERAYRQHRARLFNHDYI